MFNDILKILSILALFCLIFYFLVDVKCNVFWLTTRLELLAIFIFLTLDVLVGSTFHFQVLLLQEDGWVSGKGNRFLFSPFFSFLLLGSFSRKIKEMVDDFIFSFCFFNFYFYLYRCYKYYIVIVPFFFNSLSGIEVKLGKPYSYHSHNVLGKPLIIQVYIF